MIFSPRWIEELRAAGSSPATRTILQQGLFLDDVREHNGVDALHGAVTALAQQCAQRLGTLKTEENRAD